MAEENKTLTCKVYRFYEVGKYTVVIFKVKDISDLDEHIEDFYIVTLETGACNIEYNEVFVCGTVYGAASTPELALETASLLWDARSVGQEENPFKNILMKYFK